VKLQQNYCEHFSIQHVQPADAGRYVCIVTNEAGTTRDSGQLTVNGMNTHFIHIICTVPFVAMQFS